MHAVVHHPHARSAVLWVQADADESGWGVELVGPDGPEPVWWLELTQPHLLPNMLPRSRDFRVWTRTLEGLKPGTEYTVQLVPPAPGDRVEGAVFRTLPTSLDEPFRVLLGSCYAEDGDLRSVRTSNVLSTIGRGGPIGRVIHTLLQKVRRTFRVTKDFATTGPIGIKTSGNVGYKYQTLFASEQQRPHLKLLVGDQVYLDSPVQHLVLPMSESRIKRHISRTYSRTWSKLGWFLSHGANICSSDDHEFWNDYPHRPYWPAFLSRRFARAWSLQALNFLRSIQLARPTTTFTIGDDEPALSFFIADTRMNRVHDDEEATGEFMAQRDLDAIIAWIGALPCPGVLVLGQPILTAAKNMMLRGRIIGDRNLPAFQRQYAALCQALVVAPHDVLILGGDVHFGRIAEITLERVDKTRATTIFEVVSSPMSLLAHAPGEFSPEHVPDELARFPFVQEPAMYDYLVPGKVEAAAPVSYPKVVPNARPGRCEDHYMTIEFVRRAECEVEVTVAAHLLKRPTNLNQPAEIAWTHTVVLDSGRTDYPTEGTR